MIADNLAMLGTSFANGSLSGVCQIKLDCMCLFASVKSRNDY